MLFCLCALPATGWATTLSYPDFTDTTGLILGASSVRLPDGSPTYIRLVGDYNGRDLESQGGSVFSETPIDAGSFSTSFTFRISDVGGIDDGEDEGGDGFAFVIQNISSTAGTVGGGLGYADISPSIAVEFDTFCNDCGGATGDLDGNHVGIMLDGDTTHTDPDSTATAPMELESGDILTAFVRFDGTTMSVWLNDTGAAPSGAALVTRDVSAELAALLASGSAYVGFTAATGAAYESIDLLSWTYAGVEDSCNEPSPDVLDCGAQVSGQISDDCDSREDYDCIDGTSSSGEDGEERVYTFTAPDDGTYTIQGSAGTYDLFLVEDSGAGFQLDTCAVGAGGTDPELTFTSSAGQSWFIVVDEANVSGGSYTLTLTCPDTDTGPTTTPEPYYGGGTLSCATGTAPGSASALVLGVLLISRRRRTS